MRQRTRPPARGAVATAPGRGAHCPRRRFEPPAERPGAAAGAAPAWAGAIPVRAAGAARAMVTAGWSVAQARPATGPPAGRRVDLRRRRSAMRPPAGHLEWPPSAPIRRAKPRPAHHPCRRSVPEARPAGRAARGRGPRGRARGRTGCRAAPMRGRRPPPQPRRPRQPRDGRQRRARSGRPRTRRPTAVRARPPAIRARGTAPVPLPTAPRARPRRPRGPDRSRDRSPQLPWPRLPRR